MRFDSSGDMQYKIEEFQSAVLTRQNVSGRISDHDLSACLVMRAERCTQIEFLAVGMLGVGGFFRRGDEAGVFVGEESGGEVSGGQVCD